LLFYALLAQGHGPTNFTRWFDSKDAYSINWAPGFEPWFIIDRHLNPWYDSAFRG